MALRVGIVEVEGMRGSSVSEYVSQVTTHELLPLQQSNTTSPIHHPPLLAHTPPDNRTAPTAPHHLKLQPPSHSPLTTIRDVNREYPAGGQVCA